jgi:hypothetical protein
MEFLRVLTKPISVIFQDCSELASHLTRIARYLADDVALEFNVITRSIERHSHPTTSPFGGYHPGKTDVARVLRGHDLTISTLSDTPLGGACCVNDPLKFTAA